MTVLHGMQETTIQQQQAKSTLQYASTPTNNKVVIKVPQNVHLIRVHTRTHTHACYCYPCYLPMHMYYPSIYTCHSPMNTLPTHAHSATHPCYPTHSHVTPTHAHMLTTHDHTRMLPHPCTHLTTHAHLPTHAHTYPHTHMLPTHAHTHAIPTHAHTCYPPMYTHTLIGVLGSDIYVS